MATYDFKKAKKLVPTKTIEELRLVAADWVWSFPIEG